jgi:hypothetical protein
MLRSTNPPQGILSSILAAVLLLTAITDTVAQAPCVPPRQITDGWTAVFVYPQGSWSYVPPGGSVILNGANGIPVTTDFPGLTLFTVAVPPPENPLSADASKAPPARPSEEHSSQAPSSSVPTAITGVYSGVRFTPLDRATLDALERTLRPSTARLLRSDEMRITRIMLRWETDGKITTMQVNELRTSALRMRRTLNAIIMNELPSHRSPNHEAEAIVAVEQMVRNLEWLLPLLSRIGQSS